MGYMYHSQLRGKVMEPSAIASAIVSILLPYLGKVGASAGEKLSEKAPEVIEKLYTTLMTRFQKNSFAEETLARAEEKPDSPARQASLQEVLLEEIEKDPQFASDLQKMLKNAVESLPGDQINQSVKISGRTGDVVVLGKGNYNQEGLSRRSATPKTRKR